MSDRRISEKKIAAAFESLRETADSNIAVGGAPADFGKGMLRAIYDLESELGMAHPSKYAEAASFDLVRELILPGRFIEYAEEKSIDLGEIARKYQNGDVRLRAGAAALFNLRQAATAVVSAEPGTGEDRGVKTAARALIKQLDKANA